MATSTKNSPVSFRPWPANRFALHNAERVGFNISELLNEIVSKHLKRHIEIKAAAQVRAVRSMKPARLSTSRR